MYTVYGKLVENKKEEKNMLFEIIKKAQILLALISEHKELIILHIGTIIMIGLYIFIHIYMPSNVNENVNTNKNKRI